MVTVGEMMLYVGPATRASYGESVATNSKVWVVGVTGEQVKVKIGNGCTCTFGSFTTHVSNLRAKRRA